MTANWTAPDTYATGDLITATDLNLIRDNLEYLHTPNGNQIELTANYTTTSASFTDFSPSITLTVVGTGAPVYINFDANFDIASGTGSNTALNVQLFIDGVAQGDASRGIAEVLFGSSTEKHRISFQRRKTGLSAGSHTFKLQWKTSGNTMRLEGANVDGQFWVSEK